MKLYSNDEIIEYYDSTIYHYEQWWSFEKALGLHYGVWDKTTRDTGDAILNTNRLLAELGNLKSTDYVLDAGCGVGGSSIFLSKTYGCKCKGITLSPKQAVKANTYAKERGVDHLASYEAMDYTNTTFPDSTFDVIWSIEAMQTASDKEAYLKEMSRVLKPGGRILIGDIFKPHEYNVEKHKSMKAMLNGWAMSDFVTLDHLVKLGEPFGLSLLKERDVRREVRKSVNRLFLIGLIGMWGTIYFTLFIRKTSHFARYHHHTNFGQFFAYYKGLWRYKLICLSKQ